MRAAAALAVTIVLALMAGTAWATPSTLIWIPSTDIQAEGTWHLGIDDYFPTHQGTSAPTDVGLAYGGKRWEAGVDYFGGTDDPLAFNAKALLTEEGTQGVTSAAGIFGVGTNSDITAANIGYALASKTYRGTRFTAGYFAGRKHVLGDGNQGLLLGVDRTLNAKWWMAADYTAGESAFGATGIGASYNFAPNASVILGFVDFHSPGLDDSVTTQVDVNF